MPSALITRAEAEPLRTLLMARQIVTVHVPLLRLQPTRMPPPDKQATVVLVSSATTPRLAPHIQSYLQAARVVAIGQKTAAALHRIGIVPFAIGRGGGPEAVRLLAQHATQDDVVAYVGAAVLSSPLKTALQQWGHPVHRWAVYRNETPPQAHRVKDVVVDVLTLTSPSAAQRYVALGGVRSVPAVVIGNSTASAAREVGLMVRRVASEPSMEALAQAVADHLKGQLPQ